MLIISGCGKKEVMTGGEGTNFPYSWEIKSNGEVLIKINGSNEDGEYIWSALCDDEEILGVEQKSNKKGAVSYLLKPLSDGETQVSFTLENDIPAETEEAETVSATAPEDEEEEDPGHIIEDDDGKETGEPVFTGEEDSTFTGAEMYNDLFTQKDRLCEIRFRVIVSESEKKGKFKTEVFSLGESEFSGIAKSDDGSYKLWEDEAVGVILKVPISEELWTYEVEGTYIPEEHEEIPGIEYEEPETDENGEVKLLDISFAGFFDKEAAYQIKGLVQCNATVTFTGPDGAKKIIIEVSCGDDHMVHIVSHKTEP